MKYACLISILMGLMWGWVCRSADMDGVQFMEITRQLNTLLPNRELVDSSGALIVMTVNTSFCGSCSEKTKLFIVDPYFSDYNLLFLTDGSDSVFLKQLADQSHARVIIRSIEEQERSGIFSTYSRIFVVRDSIVVYSNIVIDDQLSKIKRDIRSILKS